MTSYLSLKEGCQGLFCQPQDQILHIILREISQSLCRTWSRIISPSILKLYEEGIPMGCTFPLTGRMSFTVGNPLTPNSAHNGRFAVLSQSIAAKGTMPFICSAAFEYAGAKLLQCPHLPSHQYSPHVKDGARDHGAKNSTIVACFELRTFCSKDCGFRRVTGPEGS